MQATVTSNCLGPWDCMGMYKQEKLYHLWITRFLVLLLFKTIYLVFINLDETCYTYCICKAIPEFNHLGFLFYFVCFCFPI